MKVRALTALALVLGSSAPALAQGTQGFWIGLLERTEIRQNTNVKKDIDQPAFLTFTRPDGGPTSTQIGLGALVTLVAKKGLSVEALVDFQKNNAISKEQDARKIGASGFWRIATNNPRHNPVVNFRSNYKNDRIKGTETWQNAFGGTVVFTGKWPFPVPNHLFPVGNAFDVVYFPNIGLELDNVFEATDPAAQGFIGRVVGTVSLGVYPAPRALRNRVELLASYAYRRDFTDSTNEADDQHSLFSAQINWLILKSENYGEFGVGLSYVDGENPDEGFTKQRYVLLALKFRLKAKTGQF